VLGDIEEGGFRLHLHTLPVVVSAGCSLMTRALICLFGALALLGCAQRALSVDDAPNELVLSKANLKWLAANARECQLLCETSKLWTHRHGRHQLMTIKIVSEKGVFIVRETASRGWVMVLGADLDKYALIGEGPMLNVEWAVSR